MYHPYLTHHSVVTSILSFFNAMLYYIFSMIDIFSIAANGESNIALQRQAYM